MCVCYFSCQANGTNTTTDGTKTTVDDDSDKPKSEVNDEKESGSKEVSLLNILV